MKAITIKGIYDNAKKTTIAFWAQRLAASAGGNAYELTLVEENTVVDYKAMLMTDIVTVTKQGRHEVADTLKSRIENIKKLITTGFISLVTDDFIDYKEKRADITCIKRKPKAVSEYLEDINKILIKMGLNNDTIVKINNIVLNGNKA